MPEKESQFYQQPQQPQQEQPPAKPQADARQQLKQYWDAAKGGWRNPHLKFEEWRDRFLSMNQWLERNPGKTPEDFRRFKTRLRQRRKPTWLQRFVGIDPGYTDLR